VDVDDDVPRLLSVLVELDDSDDRLLAVDVLDDVPRLLVLLEESDDAVLVEDDESVLTLETDDELSSDGAAAPPIQNASNDR
jgi:hypothetical protein